MATKPLTEIPTLSLLYKAHYLVPAESTAPGATSRFNDKISLIRTDITKLETDAIVNAANESLLGGGGVDGAIHRAAGPDLVRECETLDGCDTGFAKITDAYRLPCKKVIHAVGPVYYTTKRMGMHTTLLQSCYTTSLDLAVQNDCKSIAFSALSTGVYGYPSDEAAETAIQAVKGWLEEDEERATKIERVVFCQFMEKDEDAYADFIPIYFPPAASTASATTGEEEATGEPVSDEAKADGDEAADHPVPEDLKATETSGSVQKEQELDSDKPTLEETETQVEPKILDLPDVPTKDPTDPDQPESKKLKLDEAEV